MGKATTGTEQAPTGVPTGLRELVHSGLPAPSFPRDVRLLMEERLKELAELGMVLKMPENLISDAHLTVFELINNACAATPEREITFKARFEYRSIWVGVWDSSLEDLRPKVIRELDPGDITPDHRALDEGYTSPEIGGWGLPLVMAMTPDRDIDRTDDPRGKWVWARFSC